MPKTRRNMEYRFLWHSMPSPTPAVSWPKTLLTAKLKNVIFVSARSRVVFSLSDSPIAAVLFVYLAPVIGEGARQFMNAKIKYTNESIDAKVIKDFLPRPEELAFREDGVKVTIALSKKSVEFFKSEAAKHHTQYQRMIRRLIDTYVETYNKP